MDYLAKLTRLCDGEAADCWEMERHTQELADTETSMRIYWDDEASRSLWSRYAYPQNEDATRLIEHKKELLSHTEDSLRQADSLFRSALSVFEESERIALFLRDAEMETDAGTAHYQNAREYAGRVEDAAPGVDAGLMRLDASGVKYDALYALRQAVYAPR